jgi:hypothetical protein
MPWRSWQVLVLAEWNGTTAEARLDKTELRKLQDFLRRSFTNNDIRVTLDPKNTDAALVTFGERKLGSLTVDDEDGDRSFAFEMKIPVERPVLQEYLRKLFDCETLKIVARARKTDSVELNNGDDFIGIISADDPKGRSFTLQMAILDFDLEDE